ncbi:unnamed protein product [Durusdinium trenchii]|uniref:RING-CH-type domain-containing protein n=1 Tax=Durusdinium trenchii TaxID=1381693 RepID=A0ABP0JIP1_9DINO
MEKCCRICHGGEAPSLESLLLEPCLCSGSVRWIHRGCLKQWQRQCALTAANVGEIQCELCNFFYVHEMGLQPVRDAICDEVCQVLLCCTPLLIIFLLIAVSTELSVGLTAAGALLGLAAVIDVAASFFSSGWGSLGPTLRLLLGRRRGPPTFRTGPGEFCLVCKKDRSLRSVRR